jgi:hypothetical protein
MHSVHKECRWFTHSDEADLLGPCDLPALISISNTAMLRVYQIRARNSVVSIVPTAMALGSTPTLSL